MQLHIILSSRIFFLWACIFEINLFRLSYLVFHLFSPDNKDLCTLNTQVRAHCRTDYKIASFLKLCIRSCFKGLMRAKDAGIDIALHRGSGASLPRWRCLVGAGSLGGDVVRVACGYHGLLLAMGQFGLGWGWAGRSLCYRLGVFWLLQPGFNFLEETVQQLVHQCCYTTYSCFLFTCSKSDLYKNILKLKDVMTSIVWNHFFYSLHFNRMMIQQSRKSAHFG